MPKDALNAKYPRLAEIPFDSDRKLMTVVNDIDGQNTVIVKGAFDVLSRKCRQGDIESAGKKADELARKAIRVLGVAYKQIDAVPERPTPEQLEDGLIFMGLLGMIDPPAPRPETLSRYVKKRGFAL
jgi:Ca2+-transporting ATPase